MTSPLNSESISTTLQMVSSDPEKLSTKSTRERVWKNARQKFLDKYVDEIKCYEALSKVVEICCSQLMRLSGLHSQVSSRVKDARSLKIKVDKAIATLMEQEDKLQEANGILDENEALSAALSKLEGKIADRAGVRVLVYFPEDVSHAAEEIQKCGVFEDHGAVVSYTKSRLDHRKEDWDRQQKGGYLNYSDGAWISFSSVPTEDIVHRWKHSGYRAAHVHIKLNPEFKTEWDHDNSHGGKSSEVKQGETGEGQQR
jgi:ppGpp synthetase/RelA/SpoT-type nucleotidyltranferase